MHNFEIIGRLVVEKAELEEQFELYRDAIDSIHKSLICIGGPLNDNKHGYTPEQLKLFYYIQRQCKFMGE